MNRSPAQSGTAATYYYTQAKACGYQILQ